MLEKLNLFYLTVQITVVLLWKWMGPILMKNHLSRRFFLCFLSLLNWIRVLITLSLFLKKFQKNQSLGSFYEISFFWDCSYLHKSAMRPCTTYCCHVWTGAPSCFFNICCINFKNFGPLFVSLETLIHCRDVASLA